MTRKCPKCGGNAAWTGRYEFTKEQRATLVHHTFRVFECFKCGKVFNVERKRRR